MEASEIIERGTVESAHRDSMTVTYQGISVHVYTQIRRRSCRCCADTARFVATYNRPSEVDGDPLGLND